MKVTYTGSTYQIQLGSATTDPKLNLTIPEAQDLVKNLLQEMDFQNDLPAPLRHTIYDTIRLT